MSIDVALLGTGTMGFGMAQALLRAGLTVTVWNRNGAKAAPLSDAGARVAASVEDAIRDADVVVTMLFDADTVAEVMTDPLERGLMQDAIWLQTTTVGVDGTERLARLAASAGVAFVDAPVLGTKKPAEDGTLQIFWAGPPALRPRLDPVLEAIGSRTVDVAEVPGPASALKLACNAWIATLTAAAAQSIALARGLGVDPQLFLEAIAAGPQNSPYAQLKGAQMIRETFEPVSFAVDGVSKDLGLIRDALGSSGLDTGLAEAVAAQFSRASQRGHGGSDMAAVLTAFGR
jgi:3-hydroxyisobutyrate dehydrogenase